MARARLCKFEFEFEFCQKFFFFFFLCVKSISYFIRIKLRYVVQMLVKELIKESKKIIFSIERNNKSIHISSFKRAFSSNYNKYAQKPKQFLHQTSHPLSFIKTCYNNFSKMKSYCTSSRMKSYCTSFIYCLIFFLSSHAPLSFGLFSLSLSLQFFQIILIDGIVK